MLHHFITVGGIKTEEKMFNCRPLELGDSMTSPYQVHFSVKTTELL
jgi:hypothetical protein